MSFDNIPQELKTLPNWVGWGIGTGRARKRPFDSATGHYASTKKGCKQWGRYDTAVKALQDGRGEGIGFAFGNTPYAGIDIDGCVVDGVPNDYAQFLLDMFNSYSELSPSGKGIHIIVKYAGDDFIGLNKTLDEGRKIEAYCVGRFFTMTGNHLEGTPKEIHDRTDAVNELLAWYQKPITETETADMETFETDDYDLTKLTELALKHDSSGKFNALYVDGDMTHYHNDPSRADAALLAIMARWTRCNAVAMDEWFTLSALAARSKWIDRKDYRDRTIKNAIAFCKSVSAVNNGVIVNTVPVNNFYDENGTFLHNIFGRYVIDEMNICRAYSQGENERLSPLVYYDCEKQVYCELSPSIHKLILGFIDKLSQTKRNEVKTYIESVAPFKEKAEGRYICVANGVYDLYTHTLTESTPDFILTEKIPVQFNPAVTSSAAIDSFMLDITCNNAEMVDFLYEIVGYGLAPNNFLRKFFILVGEGFNGKSTFLKLLSDFYGQQNICSLSLDDMEKRFVNAQLFGKMANIGDDIEQTGITTTGTLKKIVTGDAITVEHKGQTPFAFTPRAKLFFSANRLPKIYDSSYGMNSRIVIIPFEADFTNTVNPAIGDKLKQPAELSYLLNKALEGLKRLINNKRFTIPSIAQKWTNQYILSNDQIKQFITEVEDGEVTEPVYPNPTVSFETFSTKDIYQAYQAWARNSGYKPISNTNFGREMARHGWEKKEVKREGCRFMYKKTFSE